MNPNPSDAAGVSQPRRRRRLALVLRAVMAIAIVILLGFWYWLERDSTADRLRIWIETGGADLLGTEVSIGRLELDVLPFHMRLDDLLVGPREQPLARAERLTVDLSPWGLLEGRVVVTDMTLDRPYLALPRWNPQRPLGQGDAMKLELRRLAVRHGQLLVGNTTAGFEGEVTGIDLDLRPEAQGLLPHLGTVTSGELRVGGGHLVLSQPNQAERRLQPLELRLVFGIRGRTVSISDMQLGVGTSSVTGHGTVRGAASADLQIQADLAVADIFKVWVPRGARDHDGRATFRGDLQVRGGVPFLSGRLRAAGARMSGVDLDAARMDLVVRPNSVRLSNASLSLYGGTLEGSLEVDRSTTPARVTIDYDAHDIDTAALTEWSALAGWRLAGSVSGSGNIGWQAPFLSTAAGAGQLHLELPDARTLTIPHPTPNSRVQPMHEQGSQHASPALPLPTRAEIDYRVVRGVLELREASLHLPVSTITAQGSVDFDGPLQLRARIDSRDLRQIDHLVAQYRSYRGEFTSRRLGVRGSGHAELSIGGTLAAPLISGTLRSSDLATRDLVIGNLATTLATSAQGRLQARSLRIERDGGSATGSASISIPATGYPPGPTTYALQLDLASYPMRARIAPLKGRYVSTVLDGKLLLSGPLTSIAEGDLQLHSGPLTLGSLALESGLLVVRRGAAGWDLQDLRLSGLGGRLQARGAITDEGQLVNLVASATAIDLASVLAAAGSATKATGTLDFDTTLNGNPAALDGGAALTWKAAALGGVPLGRLAIQARADGGLVAATAIASPSGAPLELPAVPRPSAVGGLPSLPATPGGGWGAALNLRLGEPVGAELRVGADLAALVPMLRGLGHPLPPDLMLSGGLTFAGAGLIDSADSWNGTARLRDARLQRAGQAAALEADATVDDGLLSATAKLRGGTGSLTLSGRADLGDGTASARAQGQLDLAAVRLWRDDVSTTGTAAIDVTVDGKLSQPTLTGTVRAHDLTLDNGGGYPITAARVAIRLADGMAQFEALQGLVAGTPFHGSATVPLPWRRAAEPPETRLKLTVQGLPVDPLVTRSAGLQRLVTGGSLQATLDLRGSGLDPRTWSGPVLLQALDLRMRDYRLQLAQGVSAELQNGALLLPDSTVLAGGRTALRLAGSVHLSPLELDLSARGQVGFEPLNVLSPYWGTGGVADLDLQIHGSPPDLAYRGTAAVRDAVLSPPPLRQPIERLQAQLVFEDRRVRIEDVEGVLGGGRVAAGGELFLRGSLPQSFRIGATVSDALLRIEPKVRVQASANLVYDGTPDSSLLSGRVTLAQGIYRRTLEPNDALLEMFEAPETDPNPLLSAIRLDVRVEGSSDLFVDNNLADVEVTADFDLRGNLAKPVALGRSRLLGGRLYWNGNTFEVLQGVVEFNNPFETEPVFEIRSRTEIRRYTIDLNFSGSLTRGVSFNYTATPPLSDLDLFNLLAFGEEPSSAVLQNPYRYQTALGLQATRYLADAYLTEVERGAERLFGVDRFRISPTLTGSETDATARMTLGKRINRNLYVTYSRLLSTSEDQLLTLEYQLTPELRIKGTRDEDGSFGVDFLVQKRIRQ